jgi:hypothetical protein
MTSVDSEGLESFITSTDKMVTIEIKLKKSLEIPKE